MARLTFQQPSPVQAATGAFRPWARSAGVWGVGIGSAAFLLLSVTPLVRREVLEKTPGLSWYFTDKTPASDKPF
ncbi:hypothetical protein FA15DRAFT_663050 [Coprinopsis marcescibilis]|uniref:Uncharacterized protein n=1 Tax=Coprinopsis marcescibilis TaxID=230819 RepID=A0A5C3LAT1_COPMA|nr:hypothetical protein FA15DRAFT_663050 [Coprinopsis marcescibilis]